jgi:MFS transporter, PAT family, beta-lactamase induction signal transducer AmpG
VSTWRAAFAVYLDRRMLVIFGLGFASGLPFLLTSSTLSYWLRRLDVDRTQIGLFALVGLPYTLKFLWSPVVDRVSLPWLTARLGRRRSWALVSQLGLFAAILALAGTDPARAPLVTAACALAIAALSATQDIAIDAYRIEVLHAREQGAGASSAQTGYRIGLLVAGAGAIALSDVAPWPSVFAALAALMLLCALAVLCAPEPAAPPDGLRDGAGALEALEYAVVAPLRDFLRRPAWPAILAFAFFYKFGDAIGGVMANPFYVDLGFSGLEVASVTKVFGLAATLAGVFLGGALVARSGMYVALLIGGVLQAVTNLLFAWQAQVGHELGWLAVAILADNVAGGLASAAFVAYLSALCRVEFTATQYALLTSVAFGGRTLFASGSGWLADQLGWSTFFVLTTLLAVPGLGLLQVLRARMRIDPTANPVP